MNGLSIIIPSKTLSNLAACITSICQAQEDVRIIVVDDGIRWMDDYVNSLDGAVLLEDRRVGVISGEKPFAFPRNCNIGIKAAGNDDVILLNDDALLQTPGGFTLLQKAADEQTEFGIISATTNVAGNPGQNPRGIGLREEPRTVAFVCVFIPRRTIDLIGLMDEQFGGFTPDGRQIYGFCDNDYCRRIRQAGLKIGIHDGCFVDHGSLRSSFRGDPRAPGDISAAGELYTAKWGDWN